MNRPSRKRKDGTKTADKRKTILKACNENQNREQTMNEKAFPLNLQKYRNLDLIKHPRFVRKISVRNYTVDKFKNSL